MRAFTAATCASVLLLQGALAQAANPAEYEVKAAFIHNVARFVEWPVATHRDDRLRLCILGGNPFGEAIELLRGRQINGLEWEVVQVRPGASLRRCRVLFVGASERDNLARILASIANSGVLTMGDSDGYAAQGVMVNFYLEQNKVRFEINHAAVQRAGFTISSQLLRLARIVDGPGGGG